MSQNALARKVIPRTYVESRSGVKDALLTGQRRIWNYYQASDALRLEFRVHAAPAVNRTSRVNAELRTAVISKMRPDWEGRPSLPLLHGEMTLK